MTTVVQKVANDLVTSVPVTLTVSATTAGNLGVVAIVGAASSQYTSISVSDNASGGSSTWVSRLVNTSGANGRTAYAADCFALKAGVTSVTITLSGGSGFEGLCAFEEVNGPGLAAVDQMSASTATSPSSAGATATVTAAGADTGTTNFVLAFGCLGNSNSSTGLSDPPSGFTSVAVQQDDSAHTSGEICHRINSSAVTDSCTWTSNTLNIASNCPIGLVSYKFTGVTGTAAITEASDTVSAAGTLTALGTAAITEGHDLIAAAGNSPTVATPVISPPSGTYASAQTLTITCATGSSSIFYTTDSTTPTPSSTPYTGPITVSVSQTVQAIATASGLVTSSVTIAAYVINTPTPPPPPTPPPVTNPTKPYPGRNIPIAPPTRRTIDMRSLAYGLSGPEQPYPVYQFSHNMAKFEFPQHNPFAQTSFPTQLAPPTFSLPSGPYTSTQSLTLSSPVAAAKIYYTTDGSAPTTASALYTGALSIATGTVVSAIAVAAGYTTSAVATASYTITGQVLTPSVSPNGGSFTVAQSVALACGTASASIFYTTDGTTPTPASTLYSAPFNVSSNETVQAMATAIGFTNSGVVSATFAFTTPIASPPTFSLAPGSYTGVQSLALAATTPSAVIHYTTDGTTPTSGSPAYSTPLSLPTSIVSAQTVKAIVVAAGYVTSSVASATYGFGTQPAQPTFSPAGGTYSLAQSVTLASTTPGAVISYSVNGGAFSTYTGPISVTTAATIVAYTQALGYAPHSDPSGESTATYAIGTPKAAMLTYFQSIAGTQAISGSTPNIYIGGSGTLSAAMAQINQLPGLTGQQPALLAIICDNIGSANTGAYPVSLATTIAQNQWTAGGLVQISPYIGDPTKQANNGSVHIGNDGGGASTNPISAANLHSLVTPGSALYTQFQSQLAVMKTNLTTIFGGPSTSNVAIFRPFIELNGAFNWFGGITGGTAFADFQALWKIVYNFLMTGSGNLSANLIWLYSCNQGAGHYTDYFPGLAYVDMASIDVYPSSQNVVKDGSGGYADSLVGFGNPYAAFTALGLPFYIAESGLGSTPSPNTCNNLVILEAIQGYAPKTMAFVPFCDDGGGAYSLASQQNASALLNNAAVINLAQLPTPVGGGSGSGGGGGGSGLVLPGLAQNVQMVLQGQKTANTSLYDSGTGFWDAPFPNTTTISWQGATPGTNPIVGNNIWRSTNGAAPVKLNSTLNTTTTWEDDTATLSVNSTQGSTAPYFVATTYTYQIEEIDSLGNSSGLSAQQNFYAYKSGVLYGLGGAFNGSNGGTTTVNFNDTVNDPNGCILFTWTGGFGYILPYAGNQCITYNMWAGAFNYLSFDYKAISESAVPNFSIDRVGDIPIYNRINGTTGASTTSFPVTTYGPAPVVGQWVTYKIPLSALLLDYGPPSAPYPSPVLQQAIYKTFLQSTSGNPGSFALRNILYSAN